MHQVIKDKKALTPICKAPFKGGKDVCCLSKGSACGADKECCDNKHCGNKYGEPVGQTICQDLCSKTGGVCKITDMCCGGEKVILIVEN